MAIVVVATLLLAGATVRRTVAHRFSELDPALALAWDPSDVTARENLANHRLAAAMAATPTDRHALSDARDEARRVLIAAPLRWAALRDLGLSADVSGDTARAAEIMARADQRGHRDVAVQGWFLQRDLAGGDAAAAVPRLDVMLRTEPELEPRLLPVMAAVLSVPAARPAWVQALAANPPWRQTALDDLAAKDADVDAVAQLFVGLDAERSPPSDSQSGVLLTRIAVAGRYADARAIWLRSARASDAAIPYDGHFRKLSGPPPFNWRIFQPDSGAAGIERRTGVGSALTASYPANTTPTIAEQLLTLAPGPYRMTGRWRVEQPASGAAVSWVLACAASAAPIGEWRHGTDVRGDWAAFDLAFVVPPGCDGQWLRLYGRTGDGFGDVATAFTSLIIQPAIQPAPASR